MIPADTSQELTKHQYFHINTIYRSIYKIMKFLIKSICLCLVAIPVVVFGNLGQNELQVSHIYGTPTDKGQISQSFVAKRYSCNDMFITVTYLYGTSQCEEYRRQDGAALTDEQIQSILENNSNHLTWTSKSSSSVSEREWFIAGPSPAADSSKSSQDEAVLAVSPQHVSAEGTKMVAVGVFNPDDNSSSTPSAPPVLRRAFYKHVDTNSILEVFTSAYESVARQELPKKVSLPVSGK